MIRYLNLEKYVRGYLYYGFILWLCFKYLFFYDVVIINFDFRFYIKRKFLFFLNNINIYSINNIICILVD